MMSHIRLLVLAALLHLCCGTLLAQAPRYYHDHSVWQQFNAMEAVGWIPSGAEWFFHRTYSNMAATPPYGAKVSHRADFNVQLSRETEYAEQVDSIYNKRLVNLGVETADRLVDVRWATEGRRIEDQLQTMQRYIGLIRSWGGTEDEYQYWKEKYNMIALNAIPMVRDSYQPGYKRVEEYQSIYKELLELNSQLDASRSRWEAMKFIEERRKQRDTVYHSRFDSIAARCMGQWKLEAASASTAHPKAKKLKNVWKDE